MAVNATVNTTRVVVKRQGRQGLPGTDGTDGLGIQTVRMAKLNNPLFWAFKKSRVSEVMFGAMSWTRSTVGYVKDIYLKTRSIAVDFPREEKDGWLIEGSSTNLILQSEVFDNASWTKTSVSITPDTTDAPNGTTTADTLTQSGAGGTVSQAVTVTADTNTKTVSFFLKQGTATNSRVRLELTGGTTQTVDVDIDWSLIDSNVNAVKYADGFYRVFASVDNNATNTTMTAYLFPDTDDTNLTVIAWGAQGEQHALTSYINTITTATTRTDDDVNINAYGNIPNISESWTLFLRVNTKNTGVIFEHDTDNFALSINDSSDLILTDTGAANYSLATALDFTVEKYISIVFDGTNAVAWIDGVEQAGVIPALSVITSGAITYGNSSILDNPLNGTLRDVRWYPFALNESENKFLAGV